jgi:hypothetical protein
MSRTEDVFETEVRNKHKEILDELESIDVDSIKAEGLRISLGGKTFTFKDVQVVNDESVEDRIRSEYKEKLNTQQQRIREKINNRIDQLLIMHRQKQSELDRKEEQMKRKFAETAKMPDLNETHLSSGLSVVKGRTNNSLIWVYHAEYNPRFIIHYPENMVSNRNKVKKPIPKRLVNKMKQDMLILIKTKNSQVSSVVTRTLKGNQPFEHYHQQSNGSDCWGTWSYPQSWNTANDILMIAKTAESILETINQGSLAESNPSGLPRMNTILKAIEDIDPVDESIIRSTSSNDNRNNDVSVDEDIWSSL